MYMSSVSRQMLLVDHDPQPVPVYDKNPEATAFVIEGQNILAVKAPRRVVLSFFNVTSDPESPEDPLTQIQAAEDKRMFTLLDTIIMSGLDINPDISVEGQISSGDIDSAITSIERHGMRATQWFMNPRDYASLRKDPVRDTLEIENLAERLTAGFWATVRDVQIIASRRVPAGVSYLCCAPEKLGRIPVRVEMTKAGGIFSEEIGMGILESRGFVRVLFSS